MYYKKINYSNYRNSSKEGYKVYNLGNNRIELESKSHRNCFILYSLLIRKFLVDSMKWNTME